MRDKAWSEEAEVLAESLRNNNIAEVDFTQFYAANYDQPTKLWNRRNEVMFMKS